jgi:hypothetical protein
MKQSIGYLIIGLTLFLASFANLGLAQSTPQQLKGSDWSALTKTAPAVATDGTNRYAAWKGASSNKICFSTFNGSEWTKQRVVGGSGWTAGTSTAPTLTWYAGQLWLAWKGQSTPTDRVWFSTWNGTSWATQQVVNGPGWNSETDHAPALGITDNRLTAAWVGVSSNEIWYSTWNSPGWATQVELSDSETSTTPTMLEVPYGRVWFWDGHSNDHIYFGGSEVPGAETNVPTANLFFAYPPENDYYVLFWKSASGNSIMYSYEFGSGFGAAQSVGDAETNQAPAAASSLGANGNTGSILAWKNATNNTIWFLDPTTLGN